MDTTITPAQFPFVMYDIELNWPYTPQAEKDNPVGYMHDFGNRAKSEGFIRIFAPTVDWTVGGVDLYTKTLVYQSNYCDLWPTQSENAQTDQNTFTSLIQEVDTRIRVNNPSITHYAELEVKSSTTANQLIALGQSVSSIVQGFYLSIDNEKDANQLDQADQVIRGI